MSRRLSVQYKQATATKKRPKVKFPDELIFLDSIKDNDVEHVRTMLRRASLTIDLNKINDTGLTALHQAVLENSLELTKLLVESDADVNCHDEDSWTPLHAAASMSFYEVAEYLLDNGADVNMLTNESERPIDLVDPDDFPLISLFLNHMRASKQTDKKDGKRSNSLSKAFLQNENLDSLSHKILDVFQMRLKESEMVKEMIQRNLNDNPENFIQSLASAVVISCLLESTSTAETSDLTMINVDKSALRSKISMLNRVIKGESSKEIVALKSIIRLISCYQQPGLLDSIISIMSEEKVISRSSLEKCTSLIDE